MKQNRTVVIDENTPLLVLAGPMFLELLLNTMLQNVDTVMFMMLILFNIIATATSVVVAQYLGAKRAYADKQRKPADEVH